MSSRFCEQMNLKVHSLDRLLELEGTGGSAIPYLGYVEVNLQIQGIQGYNKDILLLRRYQSWWGSRLLIG